MLIKSMQKPALLMKLLDGKMFTEHRRIGFALNERCHSYSVTLKIIPNDIVEYVKSRLGPLELKDWYWSWTKEKEIMVSISIPKMMDIYEKN